MGSAIEAVDGCQVKLPLGYRRRVKKSFMNIRDFRAEVIMGQFVINMIVTELRLQHLQKLGIVRT